MEFYSEVLQRIQTLPGVRSVTWAADVPLARRRVIIQFVPDNRAGVQESDWIVTDCDIVGPDYFRTLGVPLIQGRALTTRDNQDSPSVVVINETMAREYWPEGNPIGRRMKVRGTTGVQTVEIVGIARDVQQRFVGVDAKTRIYLPLLQRYFPEMTLFVHVADDPISHLDVIRNELKQIDAALPVFNVKPLEEQVSVALSQERTAAALLAVVGLLALGLASIGVYGVTAYVASRRTREIGIRMVLGATARDVLTLVARQSARPVVLGLCVGVVVGVGSLRFLESRMFENSSWDPTAMTAPLLIFLLVSALACYVPASRTASSDPATGLRHE
jgi:putative ABC transport system permease protein